MPDGRKRKADLHLSLDRRLAGDKGAFFVRAAANDLAVLGVHEGDYVLVEPASVAELEDGAIVVARIEAGSWFYRMTRNGVGMHLEPLRPGGETTVVQDVEQLDVVGRVAAFYRRIDESAGGLNLTHH
jgi:SOS-response transcriptional repressor LexA